MLLGSLGWSLLVRRRCHIDKAFSSSVGILSVRSLFDVHARRWSTRGPGVEVGPSKLGPMTFAATAFMSLEATQQKPDALAGPSALSIDAVEQLRALGATATLDLFPGLGHGIDGREGASASSTFDINPG